MSKYLDPTGQPTFGIGICARCSRKMLLSALAPDPNYPALMVCAEDRDEYDPYRLAPRAPDQIVLPFVRPDVPINTDPSGAITQDGNEFLLTEDGERYLYIG